MKFLYAKYPDFNSTDLSYFAQELFREEIKKDREKMFEFGKIDIKPFLEDMKKEVERGTSPADAPAATSSDSPAIKKEAVLDFGFDTGETKKRNTITVKKTQVTPKEKTNSSEDNTMSRRIADINDSTMTNIKKNGGTKSSNISKKDATRVIKTDTKKIGNQKKTSIGTYAALLAFLLGGGFYFHKTFIAEPEMVEVAVTKPVKVRQPAQEISDTSAMDGFAKVMLSHFDKQKMQVFINGVRTDADLLNTVVVPVGKPFTLRVQIEGRKHFIKEMNLSNKSDVEVEIPEMSAMAYGYIFTSAECQAVGEIRFEIYGEKRVSSIPMKQEFGVAFPLNVDERGSLAPATYEIFFKKRDEDLERKIDITIKREDQSIDICEYL